MHEHLLPSRCVRTLRGHEGPLQVARFSADGRYALTAGQDRTCVLWNPHRDAADEAFGDDNAPAPEPRSSTGADAGAMLIKRYRGHGQDVCDVALAADGARFASVGGDKCAVVWDVAQGRVLRKLFGHEQRLSSCCWAGGGGAPADVLVTGSGDKSVRCWDLRAGGGSGGGSGGGAACIQTLGLDVFKDGVTRVAVVSDSAGAAGPGPASSVLACAMDGRMAEWDLRHGRRTVAELGCPVATMALSHDQLCVLLAAPAPPAVAEASASCSRLVLTERGSGTVLAHYGGHANTAYRVQPVFAHDDAHVACGGEDGAVTVWDLVEATVALRLASAHRRVVACVDLARYAGAGGGEAMLTASFDGTAKLWLAPDAAAAVADSRAHSQ